MGQSILALFSLIALFTLSPTYAINTVADGYRLVDGAGAVNIDAHGTSCDVTNTSGVDQFVATATSAEWQSFRSNLPAGMSINSCTTAAPGYFLMSNNLFAATLGGLSGADSQCLNQVTTYDWLGKGGAGTLTAARVKAFLCDSATCNNLAPNTTYHFASANLPTTGGATFTTDSSGRGPFDSSTWSGSSHFGRTTMYFSNRGSVNATTWSTTPKGGADHCVDWTNGTGGQKAWQASPTNSDQQRWDRSWTNCTSSLRIVCFVDPPDNTPTAIAWADFTDNSTSETISGINASIDLELSAANGTGAPTYEYRKNGGSWTVFTTITPATVSFMDGDTLEFQVSGTENDTGTITVTNTSDGNTTLDTVVGTVGPPATSIGYFVATATNQGGNYGGLTGADSKCLTDLQANTWLGKGDAGTLSAARVRAFLCDGSTCNNLLASTTYAYASMYDDTAGGTQFTTDGSGLGPNDSVAWNGQFGLPALQQAHTGRNSTSATQWANTSSGTHCNNWSSGTGGQSATVGRLDTTNASRWSTGTFGCNNNFFLICIVDPE